MTLVNGDLHFERIYRGHNIVIDVCRLENGKYEAMTMWDYGSHKGEEIESSTHDNLADAEKAYLRMYNKYSNQECAELKGKYAKLRDDLKLALESAILADCYDDGGTCNFDSPSIEGNGWRRKLVEQAAKEAGTSVFKWKLFSSTRWVFGVPGGGQANRRTRKAEAMTDTLKGLGYDAMTYYQMD